VNGVRRGGYTGNNYHASTCRSGCRYTRAMVDGINAIGFRSGVYRGGYYNSSNGAVVVYRNGNYSRSLVSVIIGFRLWCN